MGETVALATGTVTFLFTDIEGSTQLWEQHPQAMREALARHDALLRHAIESHGGRVFKTMGDQFCAAFPDAARGLAAALAAQRALRDCGLPIADCGLGEKDERSSGRPGSSLSDNPQSAIRDPYLKVRMALHAGPAEERDGDYFGPTLNRVARLLAAGHGKQTLLSQAAGEGARASLPPDASLRDLGAHRLKDLQQPEHVFQLMHPDLPADFPPLRSLEAFAHNLPAQLTRFIGREREIAEVKALLGSTRLLTLTGSGGCGKTRLSLQVAADLVEQYADGVWLVELAALTDPILVPQTIAAALGVREKPTQPLLATLSDYLHPRSLLLVLDNCEHLLAACAQLADTLLRACPSLRLLASSREGLGIAGELIYRVPSLSMPPAVGPETRQTSGVRRQDAEASRMTNDASRMTEDGSSPAALLEYESVRLFLDRAVFSRPNFTVTRQNAGAVAQICQRLDGIPLAIELAAARVKMLPVEQIAARLDDRFRMLTGGLRTALPRQQTLQALIDWSYDLLLVPERTVLRRLSVFAGGWTLEAAEAVCAGEGIEEWDVLELLSRLLDKSLVLYEEQGPEARYRLLETVRQYARDRLLEAGEAATVRQRHMEFFLRLAEEAEPKLGGAEQVAWLDRLEREHDNLRTALEWCKAADSGAAELRLASALAGFWWTRGDLREGREELADALARTEALGPTLARAKALNWAGQLAQPFGEYAAARALYEEALAILRGSGDTGGVACSLSALGNVARVAGDYGLARQLIEESLSIWRELGDQRGIAGALGNLGDLAHRQGDDGQARALLEESLAFFREVNDKEAMGYLIFILGNIARAEGNYPLARRLYEEDLAIGRELGIKWPMPNVLDAFGQLAEEEEQPARAARLMGAAEALREALHTPLSDPLRPDYDRAVAATRTALGEERFAAAWAEGRALPLEQAMRAALEEVPDG